MKKLFIGLLSLLVLIPILVSANTTEYHYLPIIRRDRFAKLCFEAVPEWTVNAQDELEQIKSIKIN